MMKSFRSVFAFSFMLMVSGQEFSEEVSEANVDELYYELGSPTTFIRSGLVEQDGTLKKLSSISELDDEAAYTNSKPKPSESLVDKKPANDAFTTDVLQFKENLTSSVYNSTFNTSTANSLLSDFKKPLEKSMNKLTFRGISKPIKKKKLNTASFAIPKPTSFMSSSRIPLTKNINKATHDLSKTSESDPESESESESLNTSTDSNSTEDIVTLLGNTRLPDKGDVAILNIEDLSKTSVSDFVSGNESLSTNTDSNATEEFYTLFSNTGLPNKGDRPILNRKVFKGRRSTIGEHPYIVSIRRNYSHFLTGSLLRKNIVVTVAHPIEHVPIYELGVVMGESYNERGTSIVMVVLIVIHSNYDRYTLNNDLALLMTFGEGSFRCNVQNLKGLYKSNTSLHEKVAFVTGWGRCDFTGDEICLPRSSVYFPDEVTDPMLRSISFKMNNKTFKCKDYHKLGLSTHSRSICIGDSRQDDPMTPCLAVPGAPLVVEGTLAGILSWGLGCGYTKDLPLVYTDLRKYKGWLKKNTKILAKLDKSDLTQLFAATKAYLLSGLTYITRDQQPIKHMALDRPIELNALDDVLVALKGKLYDIRDFLEGGKYHASKKSLYKELKVKLMVEILDNNTLPFNVTHDSDDSDDEYPLFYDLEDSGNNEHNSDDDYA